MMRRERRFDRQFRALERLVPPLRRPLKGLRGGNWFVVRFPLAIVLTAGGLLWFLPILGLWMLPAGLLLLAVDVPVLRGPISALVIRGRMWAKRLMRRWRAWRGRA